jgi:hypothetical protein
MTLKLLRETQYSGILFDTMPSLEFIVDEDVRILDANRAALPFIGWILSVYKVISEPVRSTWAYFKSACSQRSYKPGQGIMNVSLVVLKTQLEPTDLSML